MEWQWSWMTITCIVGLGVSTLWAVKVYRSDARLIHLGLAMTERAHPMCGVRPEVVQIAYAGLRNKCCRLLRGPLCWLVALILAGLALGSWLSYLLPFLLGVAGTVLFVQAKTSRSM